MTAPFAASLCGYRSSGMPSTSDSHQADSVEWGHALFNELQVSAGKAEIKGIGSALEAAVVDDLHPVRPDLVIERSKPAVGFEQYRHLGVSAVFAKVYKGDLSVLEQAIGMVDELPKNADVRTVLRVLKRAAKLAQTDDQRVRDLIKMLPEESLLRLDIAVTAPSTAQRLLIGVSAKWSLRTDRAQDCVAQGGKLVALRRGHMPHYAVLTMEPRPSMLRLLAYGSGSLDCVYHLALDELISAANALAVKKNSADWPARTLLERMVLQNRVRPYQALVDEVKRLPG